MLKTTYTIDPSRDGETGLLATTFSALAATLAAGMRPRPRPKNWARQERVGVAAHSEPVRRRARNDVRLAARELAVVHAEHNATSPGHAKRCVNPKKLRRRVRLMEARPDRREAMTGRRRSSKAFAT